MQASSIAIMRVVRHWAVDSSFAFACCACDGRYRGTISDAVKREPGGSGVMFDNYQERMVPIRF